MPDKERGTTRRELLRLATLFGAQKFVRPVEQTASLITPVMIPKFSAPIEQLRDWQSASVSNKDFLKEYEERLKRVTITCSFSPEEFFRQMKIPPENQMNEHKRGVGALKTIIEDFNIRTIRLGIRWNNAVSKSGELDLNYYLPYLDFCFRKGVDVCLNVGPIKTFRHPEVHVPENIFDTLRKPPNGSVLYPSMEISKEGFEHLSEILVFIKKRYGREAHKRIKIIQPDNEPFDGFGEENWKMSRAYLRETTKRIHSEFPEARILINTMLLFGVAKSNLGHVSDFFREMILHDPTLKGKLVSGVDYYYETPWTPNIFGWKPDPISVLELRGSDVCARNIALSRAVGYEVEVTEGQAEPWGRVQSPGNSGRGYRYMVLRSAKYILDKQRACNLGMWGAEYLVAQKIRGTWTQDHEEIADLTRRVNDIGV